MVTSRMNRFDLSDNSRIFEDFLPWDREVSGWHGNDPIFEELITNLRPKLIIEVGTWLGQSAIQMAQLLEQNELADAKIICVDTWLGALEFWHELSDTAERDLRLHHGYPQVYYQFLSNIVHAGLERFIYPFPNTSLIAARYLAQTGVRADLIYIDASHDSLDVELDVRHYAGLLNPDGVIFGDDVSWPGLLSGVERGLAGTGLSLEVREMFWIARADR